MPFSQEVMNKPAHFETMEDYAAYRPIGEVTQEQAGQLIASAITFAREQHIKRLLVNITGLTGLESPNLAERYFYIREWARIAQGEVCVAMVTNVEMTDPDEIEGIIAENIGFRGKGFVSEEDALAWLQSVQCPRIPEGDTARFIRR